MNKLIDENGTITDPGMIANNFNNYFLNVANKITSKMTRNQNSVLRYLHSSNNINFFIAPTVLDKVFYIIQSI